MSRIVFSIFGAITLLSTTTAMAGPPEPSRYWLGIECLPVPSVLRSQLDLPSKDGLLVEAVVRDSPAAKAGIRSYDVLIRAGEKALVQPRDLIEAIELAKGGKLPIELVRGGRRQTVEAVPVERPEGARSATQQPLPGDWEAMQKWIERVYPGGEADGRRPPLHYRFFHPGAIVPRDAVESAPLPENMSIVISKEGKQPAKIAVKRGDEKWEVTEKELDKLPADVRPHVERMLGHNLLGMLMPDASAVVPEEQSTGDQNDASPPHASAMSERMQEQFEALNRRMDRLMKEVEELHGGRQEKKPAEK